MGDTALVGPRYGHLGKVLFVDLSASKHWVEQVDEAVYRSYLGGYGLGAWLMWKHFPPGTDPLAPEACFAISSGLLTGLRTPFSGRIQIVGKSPLTGTWADSNSGGSVCSHLRQAGYDAVVVRGKAAVPTLLVIRDGEITFEPAGDLWGQEIPETFDAVKTKFGGKRDVGVSAIGPAGEKLQRIASVMNDRYHAFGRQGFGAIYGSKNLKAIVVSGTGEIPIAKPEVFKKICKAITDEYKKDLSVIARFFAYMGKPKGWLGWMYRLMTKLGMKVQAPTASMRRMWSQRGTTAAVALSVENGDAPIKNWSGVGSRDFPLAKKGMKIDGGVVDKYITKKLSCGDCPMPCKGIVKVKSRGLTDVRRPDYETIVGFGANLLNDDIELIAACHDACNRYGIDAVSSSATLAWVCEATEKGILTAADLDGIDMTWGNGEGALLLTIKMGSGEGCGAWLGSGVQRAAAHVGKGSDDFAVHILDGRDVHRRSHARSPHRRLGVVERDLRRRVLAARRGRQEGLEREVEGHRGQGQGPGAPLQCSPGDERPRPVHVHDADRPPAMGRSPRRRDRLGHDRRRHPRLRGAHPEPARRVQPPRGHRPRRLQAPPPDAR